jgi:CheY-like chemotaxis protein
MADGLLGVERARRSRPQAMVVDLGLPSIDGYEVARRVRAELGADVLLVALSGYGQPSDRRRATEAGFDVHLVKPADLGELQRLLGRQPRGAPPPQARAEY